MTIVSRPFRDERDYERMREMLVDTFSLAGPPDYCSVGELDWWRWTANDGEGISVAQLWFDGDDLAAFAWPGKGQVDLLIHPQHREVAGAMLDWVMVRPVDGRGATAPKTWAFDTDHYRVALLREQGFERKQEAYCFRQRSLNIPVPAPALADGFRIRNVEGEHDLERRVDVHRDAFAPSRMTVEKHRNVMQSRTYRPELDLVVVAPDESFAAYCLIWFDERNRIGVFEPVGCHATHRRMGLTKAVMHEGLRRLQGLGATDAFVNNHLGEVAPAALYDSVGLRVLDENHAWVKART